MRKSRVIRAVNTVVAVLVIIIVILGAGLAYLAARGPTTTTVTTTAAGAGATVTKTVTTTVTGGAAGGLQGEIPIGLAIAVSGGYAVDGPKRLKGAMLAIEEVNAMLEKAGAPFRFKPVHEDTGATAEGAVKVLQRFVAAGIKVVVGPLSTGETKAVKPIADSNKVVVISPSSTGIAAAIPDDYVFRMPPPDIAQSKALAKILYSLGITKVVVIARDDDYGRGLADGFAEAFQSLGGQVKKIMYQINLPDYASEVNQLAREVRAFGADEHTAVLIISFDKDGQNILGHAAQDPTLAKVRWFGPDSMKRASFLPPNTPESVGEFLLKVKFSGTFPSIARNPVTEHFEKAYKEKYGIEPTPYAYYAYDAAWIACLSIMAAGKYDGEAVKNILPTIAYHFMGATGHKVLDKNGDAAFADYGIWQVVKEGGKYTFKDVGVWKYATGQIIWKQQGG